MNGGGRGASVRGGASASGGEGGGGNRDSRQQQQQQQNRGRPSAMANSGGGGGRGGREKPQKSVRVVSGGRGKGSNGMKKPPSTRDKALMDLAKQAPVQGGGGESGKGRSGNGGQQRDRDKTTISLSRGAGGAGGGGVGGGGQRLKKVTPKSPKPKMKDMVPGGRIQQPLSGDQVDVPTYVRQRLHFQGVLGRGAFGVVYLCTFKGGTSGGGEKNKMKRNDQVAVKTVHMDGDYGVIKKMGRMLAIQQQLANEKHPDIAHLIEAYMVRTEAGHMLLCKGGREREMAGVLLSFFYREGESGLQE